MTEAIWIPGLVVLALGLAGGWLAVRAIRASAPRGKKGAAPDGDLALELGDLKRRRDEIYQRLRHPDLGEGDRRKLELAAARTLRELDRLEKSAPRRGKGREYAKTKEGAAPQPSVETRPASAAWSARHPLIVGFAFGAGMMAVIALLLYWAGRDARPGERQPPMPGGAVTSEEPHPGGLQLSPEEQQEVASLEAYLETAPDDFNARKRFALLLLTGGDSFRAFSEAEKLLAAQPEDIDAHYIKGVVRLTMGQDAEALTHLDRVLELYPQHVRAMVAKGVILFRGGDQQEAIAVWQEGLAASGGSNAEIEQLLDQAWAAEEEPMSAAEGSPFAAQPVVEEPAAPPAPTPVDTAAEIGEGYRVRLALAEGITPPGGGVLFVFLRPDGGGPPVAVKRLEASGFPLELTLSAADAMMGGELPDSGILVARLDADGSASSRGPEDLEAEAAARLGDEIELVLSK